ncbi:MAG: hypothetical protein CH6_2537 [Candidatus Kapaibacterium sp.]|nr:MAG: hypothetical protein CH6_2537 [Candidatus Kapabacteria bacterium]
MKTDKISLATPSKGFVCILLFACVFLSFPLQAFDDSTFVWRKLFYRKPGDNCGFEHAYLSNTDSIFVLPDLRCFHLVKTLSGEILYTSSEYLGWQNPRAIIFFDGDRYFIARRNTSTQGVFLYETQRVLNGDLIPLDTIRVEGVEMQDYDVSPGGKYLVLQGYLYGYIFDLPTGNFLKSYKMEPYGRRPQARFLNDDTLVIAVDGWKSTSGEPRYYWIRLYDINKGMIIDTIYSNHKDCPIDTQKPWIPVPCTPLGPTCDQEWYGWTYCVPMFTVSRTGRYILYGFVPQEYIDSNVFAPPLWWALYDVREKKVLWKKQYDNSVSHGDFGIFKFAADDKIILLHATHIIDVKTGDVVYIWGEKDNKWIVLKQHYFDITKDGRYIISGYESDNEAFTYLRRNPYVDVVNEASEETFIEGGTIVPNPADGKAVLEIDISESKIDKITINTLQGEEIKVIFEGMLPEGKHLFEINTKELASGMYFVVVQTSKWLKTYKLIVTK